MQKSINLLVVALLIGVSPAVAASNDKAQRTDKSSKVDLPSNLKGSDAKTASPGTVGAMRDAGGGSFTASESDKKKNLLKAD